jgi:DNA-binding winged helix-turn-helix (wHTH) protein/tetratricopeptide (TPR) repeat protein
MVLAFGDFELDEERCELRCAGQRVELQQKPLTLLAYLVRHRGRTVSKAELFAKVWPDVIVSDSALTSALRDVRRALGDDAPQSSWIRTTRGLGFRFVAPAEEYPAEPLGIRAAASSDLPLVGRTEALAKLDAALDRAWRGRTQVVLLTGEAGIGKTRLAQELGARAELRGWRTYWGRCWEGPAAPAFWPWITVLRAALRGDAEARIAGRLGPQAALLAPLLHDALPRLVSAEERAESADSGDARLLLFDAVACLLRALSRAAPLVIVIDDLQWADLASVALLRFLASHVPDAHVLLVATYRNQEVETKSGLTQELARLLREESVERIELDGLSLAESSTLVARLVDHEPDPDFARALHERTLGNPFFIEESLRSLAQTLPADRRHGEWTHEGAPHAAGVSDSIRDLLGRRVAALPGACRTLLETAAVIGFEFRGDLLEQATSLREQGPAAALRRAESAQLVRKESASSGLYRFRHPLIREAIYAALDDLRRRALHRAVGEALERLHGADAEPPLAALAHHFTEAGPDGVLEKALGYSIRAARASLARFAFEDAASHLARALSLQERAGAADAKLRCELLVGMGEAQLRAGEHQEAKQSLLRAVALARAAGAPDLLARAAIGIDQARWVLVDEPPRTWVPLLEEARASLGDGDPRLHARLMARLGRTLCSARDPQADALTASALAEARTSHDPTALGAALMARIDATWRPGGLEECTALAQELTRIGSDPAHAHHGFVTLFDLALQAGDADAAARALEQARAAAGVLRIPWLMVSLQVTAGRLAALRGRFDEAEAAASTGLREAQRLRSGNLVNGSLGLLFTVRWLQGRLGELLPALLAAESRPHPLRLDDAAGEAPDEREVESGSKTWRAAVALARLEAGDVSGARQEFERLARSRFLPRDATLGEPLRLVFLAQLCARFGDGDAARILAAEIRPWLPLNLVGPAGFAGSSCHWAALLAATQGQTEAALRLLDEALDTYRRMDALPCIAWAQAARAQILARGGATKNAEVVALVDEARASAQRLGMPGLVAQLERLFEPLREPLSSENPDSTQDASRQKTHD